jgi:hypothetical protein
MKHLFETWQRFVEAEESSPFPSPEVESILSTMETLSIDELRDIWHAVADISKRKQKELKASFKKGDRVEWDRKDGKVGVGTVRRRGGKFVMVVPDGDDRSWKKYPSSLRKVE